MNYRHAFHAGNFADVVKHVVLTRILMHLRGKPAAFRVIDTHAGAGLYDLTGAEAQRGGEWRNGILRLWDASLDADVEALLAPYRETIAALNAPGRLAVYPGSPAIVRAWLRPQDRLIACELERNAAAALAENLRGDTRIKTVVVDGWTALSAYVPPKERRGLVLVDPSFEEVEDYIRLSRGLAAAHRKWAGGVYLLWYPIKERREPERLARRLQELDIAKILRVEVTIAPLRAGTGLNGSGLIIVNPPWTLEAELLLLLPALARVLATGGGYRLDWLAGE
jgi:23S rRNA (adenine2030-N6)-methyltransferase